MAKTQRKTNKRPFPSKNGKKGYIEKEYKASQCPGNDFAWYNKNPKLLTSASSLIFSKRYGDIYSSIKYTGSNYNMVDTGNRSVAGVVRATFYPFVSAVGADADPINMAAKNLYTWLRHKNSGAKVYEQSDLIQVLLSSGSIKAAIEFAKKLLRCVATYSAVNRFAMRHILPYSDPEFTNIVSNLANYTARLNMIIAKSTSIIIPKDIPVFSRWKWLSANVWRDDELNKCSYYSFQPEVIWHYDWANHKCTTNSLLNGTFAGLLNTIEYEIDNLLGYEDYGTISGDILKAYGEGNIDVTTGMDLGEVQDPTLDADAIRQFKNMIIAGSPYNGAYEINQVSPNTQLLKTVNTNADIQSAFPGKYVFDTAHDESPFDAGFTYLPKLCVTSDQPTVEECVEQTRLSAVIKTVSIPAATPFNALVLDEVGTEVITGCKAFYFKDSSFATLTGTQDLDTLTFLDRESGGDLWDSVKDRAIDTAVKGDPQYAIISYDGQDVYCVQYFHGDNITVLDESYLATVHKACVLSEWTMPMFNLLEIK